MSISAFLVAAFLDSMAPGPRMLTCTFPPRDEQTTPIRVRVEATPSLLDRLDRFHIRMHLDGQQRFRGLAQPIERTDARDVLIRARTGEGTFHTIGLREDGVAALSLLELSRAATGERGETREGTCRGFEGYLRTWLSP